MHLHRIVLNDCRPTPTSDGSGIPPIPVQVLNADCLDVAKTLQDEGCNPVVLNMANAYTPGGGYMTGAGSQEENLFRRSDYCKYLTKEHYPIENKAC